MRRFAGLSGLVLIAGLLLACSGTSEGPEVAPPPPPPASTDWAPAPRDAGGLQMVAQADAKGFRLFTKSGDKTFLPGVNLGSTTPLHQPGEVGTIPRADFTRWIAEMAGAGARVVRVYTLLPPSFYDELARFNQAHPETPLYLVQGVYLPDESYTDPGKTLYTPAIDDAFSQEIEDIEAAVHGDLERDRAPGRAGGTYTTDVSPWLLAWIAGIELDPAGSRQTDRLAADQPYRPGRYFAATADATPTERWLAGHLDDLAALEAARGQTRPIAFANWPTDDPLRHPDEPLSSEDLAQIDANHVLPTTAWPGGTFADFHAYPYYPDVLRHDPAYAETLWRGKPDRYAGYLTALKEYFAPHMPLVVGEFGVPSSLGSAHLGTPDAQGRLRGQGHHSEQEAMEMNAEMLRMMKAQGIAGGFVFEWTDEWFKGTWNTQDHQDAERRQLWHDPLTNEQWFGMVATDPDPLEGASVIAEPDSGPFAQVHTWADASWVHLDLELRDALPDRLVLEADLLPDLDGPDYRVVVRPKADTAQVFVRRELDPIRLDVPDPLPAGVRPYDPQADAPWHPYRLLINRAYPSFRGGGLPPEFQDVGKLVRGNWQSDAADYDSLATWQVDDTGSGSTVHLRLPWSMLGLADPSSRTALGPGRPAQMVKVPGIGFTFDADGEQATQDFTWPTWNHTTYKERPKAGREVLDKAMREVAP